MPSRPRGGLGRGLDSLIPQVAQPDAARHNGTAPVASISSNPYQPRSSMDAEQLESLADSIREHGVLQPLLVQPDAGGYRLIAGHRRLEAARRAGLEEVPVVVREPRSEDESLLLALVENLQRTDLNPLEEAAAYRELSRRFGLSAEEIARRTGRNRSTVANSLRLLDLTPEVKVMLEEGRITEGHARALLALREPEAQARAARTIIERGLNVRQTEALVRQLAGQRLGRSSPVPDPVFQEVERRFRDALGTKVSLAGTPRKGKLTIHFYSEEEFESLYRTIIGRRVAGELAD